MTLLLNIAQRFRRGTGTTISELPPPSDPFSIQLLPSSFDVVEGSTYSGLVATIRDAAGNILPLAPTSYEIDDTDVATINASTGVVTGTVGGAAAGPTALIVAKYQADGFDLVSPAVTVTVQVLSVGDPVLLQLVPSSFSVFEGATYYGIVAVITDADDNILDLEPTSYEIDDTDVATINTSTGAVTGAVGGTAAGPSVALRARYQVGDIDLVSNDVTATVFVSDLNALVDAYGDPLTLLHSLTPTPSTNPDVDFATWASAAGWSGGNTTLVADGAAPGGTAIQMVMPAGVDISPTSITRGNPTLLHGTGIGTALGANFWFVNGRNEMTIRGVWPASGSTWLAIENQTAVVAVVDADTVSIAFNTTGFEPYAGGAVLGITAGIGSGNIQTISDFPSWGATMIHVKQIMLLSPGYQGNNGNGNEKNVVLAFNSGYGGGNGGHLPGLSIPDFTNQDSPMHIDLDLIGVDSCEGVDISQGNYPTSFGIAVQNIDNTVHYPRSAYTRLDAVIKLNSRDQRNGELWGYIDGVLVTHSTGIRWRVGDYVGSIDGRGRNLGMRLGHVEWRNINGGGGTISAAGDQYRRLGRLEVYGGFARVGDKYDHMRFDIAEGLSVAAGSTVHGKMYIVDENGADVDPFIGYVAYPPAPNPDLEFSATNGATVTAVAGDLTNANNYFPFTVAVSATPATSHVVTFTIHQKSNNMVPSGRDVTGQFTLLTT